MQIPMPPHSRCRPTQSTTACQVVNQKAAKTPRCIRTKNTVRKVEKRSRSDLSGTLTSGALGVSTSVLSPNFLASLTYRITIEYTEELRLTVYEFSTLASLRSLYFRFRCPPTSPAVPAWQHSLHRCGPLQQLHHIFLQPFQS